MAITSRPQDKYAFLFTGPTQARFMTDLENVYATLTNYYNYPAANIRVVLGSAPAVLPSFSFVSVASLADLATELTTFKAMATGPALPGLSKSALFYFTGGGVSSGGSKLLTDGAAASASNTVDTAWLAPHLAITDCQVNVVMQQSFAGGFSAVVSDPEASFTSACTAAENSVGNPTEGSFFTYGWCKGLKYEQLPPTTPNSGDYAEQLGPVVGEPNNQLVSMRKATEFGKQIQGALGFGAFGTPACISASPQHLGQPSFLIRDSVSPWWESPDIYLTHPNHAEPDGDLYIPDPVGAPGPIFNNTITIKVRNNGTHPVRLYSVGIELFKTGIGVTNDQHTIVNNLVAGGGPLLPLKSLADIGTPADRVDVAEWNTPFTQGTTHECIRAEAKLQPASVDFTWSIVANDYEGQRNTDELPMAMEPPATTQLPAAEIRGPKQHEYELFNRFDEPRRYAVVFPRDYAQLTAGFELAWFEKSQRGALTPARVVNLEGRQSFIVVSLQPREARTLVLRTKPARGAKAVKESRVPFAILVEGLPVQNARPVDADPALIGAIIDDDGDADRTLGAIAGFTVVLRHAAATLAGTVLDRKDRPVANARITVATVNGTTRAVVTTDANGRYELRDVNPDVYRVTAETANWRSETQTLVVSERAPSKIDLRLTEDATPAGTHVKVIVDRIRIKRDHESKIRKWKGKAEVAFTSTVVPDFDDGAKQVTRLPGKGAVAVSGKPGINEIPLGLTVFEGVVKGTGLSITIDGKKLDIIDRDEKLPPYKRTFAGNPETWAGNYQPGDELMDREDVGEWGVWYRIVT